MAFLKPRPGLGVFGVCVGVVSRGPFARNRKAVTLVRTLHCVLQQAVKSNKPCSITLTNPHRSLSQPLERESLWNCLNIYFITRHKFTSLCALTLETPYEMSP